MLAVGSAESAMRAVGLQRTTRDVLAAAVEVSRKVLSADTTFAAVGDRDGNYPITIMSGIRDPRFGGITVRPEAGLGGQVLLRKQPVGTGDYAHDPTISRDFVHVVSDIEGLGGMGCVPIIGPVGIEALLYVGLRVAQTPGDRALTTLSMVASYAELALHNLAAREQELELELLRERQRLAVELHDSVAQTLFSIGVAAHYSRGKQDTAALLATMEEIETTAAHARRQLRETLQRLGRYEEGIGFEARLEGEIRLFESCSGCRVKLLRRGHRRTLPQPVETLVVETVVEGLRNAAKHEGAILIVASLVYGPRHVSVVLQSDDSGDAGPALDPGGARWRGERSGAGLTLLRQRAEALGGTVELVTERGMRVLRLELPVQAAETSPR